jgi:hypothetical protein
MIAKKFVIVGFTLALGLLITGCATNAGRYDQNSPIENDCTLVLPGSPTGIGPIPHITSFDGIPVDWKGGFAVIIGIMPGKEFRIQIPAGKHTLIGSSHTIVAVQGETTVEKQNSANKSATARRNRTVVNQTNVENVPTDGPPLTTTYDFVAGHTYKVEVTEASVLQFVDITK